MIRLQTTAIALVLGLAVTSCALAAEPVPIGMITTLSGPAGYEGQEVRDAFQLVIDEDGGTLGGVPVKMLVEDDALNPGKGKQIAERFLEQGKVKIFTGILYSNVLLAALPDILKSGAFYISPNAGPSNYAGKDCNRNFFVVSWQNDEPSESAGQNATRLGFKKMFVIAPNYEAGKDAVNGFKRFYKGKIVGEIYNELGQTDFAIELAQIGAAKPDAVFEFEPGGLGITFLKQYRQAGLHIPLVTAVTSMDVHTRNAVGAAALGINLSTHWAADFDNPANRHFVAAFKAKYKRSPTFHAAQAYDTARLIASALKAVHGDVAGNPDGFRAALRKADFASVRGRFSFAANQYPVQDWYAARVLRDPSGAMVLKTGEKLFANHTDAYGAACKM